MMEWVLVVLEVRTVTSSSSSKGILQRPVDFSLYPDMIVLPCFVTTTLSLSRVIVHPWSAKMGREISELPARVLNLYAVRVPGGRLGIFRSHCMLEVMCVPSGCVARMMRWLVQSLMLGLSMHRQCSVEPLSQMPSLFLSLRRGSNRLFAVCTMSILLLTTLFARPCHFLGFPYWEPPMLLARVAVLW